MKIAATSAGPNGDSVIDPRFGRCAYFIILDSETGDLEATPNPFLDAVGGAGTQAAQWLIERDVAAVLTGRCGPKAAALLDDAGVRMVEGVGTSVREAAERLRIRGAADDPTPVAVAVAGEAALAVGAQDGPTGQPQAAGAGRGQGRCRGAGGGQGGRGAGQGPGRGRGAGGRLGRRARG